MDKEDARKQSLGELHERRKQVIRLYKRGYRVMQIVEMTRLSWPTVQTAISLYEAGGAAALKPKPRGKQEDEDRILAPSQEVKIRKLICDKRPEQLKTDFTLWTRSAVMLLIERECAIKLSVRAVGNYLRRWGFTPQKPIRRAYERRPEAVMKWLGEKCSAIARRARSEGGEIHWGDETALVNNDARGRGYVPKGKTPVAYAPGARQKFSMISTVTNQGNARWMIVDDVFNADRLIEFLNEQIMDALKKIFLILDNLRVHHSKPVKAWLADRGNQIKLFYFPSYSPKLNPNDRLNADLNHAIGAKVAVRSKAKLKSVAEAHMTTIEKSNQRVKAYFQDPNVCYAA